MEFLEKQRTFRQERKSLDQYQKELQDNRQSIGLILDQVIDPQNIGGFFRLADAARLKEIIAYKMKTPLINKKIKRISRSTSDIVPHLQIDQLKALEEKTKDTQVLALEWTNESIPYQQFTTSQELPCYLIVGNEKSGVSPELLAFAKQSIHIPMYGLNTSMNVVMASAIAIYHLVETFGKKIPSNYTG